jgi:putative DNA primase/helicase
MSAITSLLTKGLLPLPESAVSSGRAIPFCNGLLDLATHALTPITPQTALTWCLPYAYDSAADCPTIKSFLLRAVTPEQMEPGDRPEELVEFLRAWFASLLTGHADLQRYLHLLGHGGTGKGAVIRLAVALVSAQNATVTDLRNLETNRFETAKLYGKRLAAITDSSRYGGSIDVFKAITGQDPLRFEEKYRQQGATFTFDGMVLLASNEPLQFSDFTGAVERRRITVEFNRIVTDAERAAWDRLGGETAVLHKEIPGLINWALGLSREEVTNRIQREPQQIRRANRAALEATNPIAGWLLECVAPDTLHKLRMGKAEEVQVTETSAIGRKETERRYRNADHWAYANYCAWCAQHRRLPVTSHRFRGLVVDLALTLGAKVRGGHDRDGAYIEGLKLRGPDESPAADPWRDGSVMDCDGFEGNHHTQPVDCDGCDGFDGFRQKTFSHSTNKERF